MSDKKVPVTPAVRALRAAGVDYEEHVFDYGRYPGAMGAAVAIGVDPHVTAKSIVFETSDGDGAIVLMHGDLEVSAKKLARKLGVKSAAPASQERARRWTGYEFGGTTPLGTRTGLPVLAQETLIDLEKVYVNAGSRGFLIGIDPTVLIELTGAATADLSA
jgi:Cys-tRNA(Pro) deacylase